MACTTWLGTHFPEAKILSLEEFLEGDNLHLVAANNTSVEIKGIAILNFCVGKFCVNVPFVICSEEITQPIIGYNVIKHLVRSAQVDDIPGLLLELFPSITEKTVTSFINIVKADVVTTSAAWTTKPTVVPPHTRCRLKCRTKLAGSSQKQTVIFNPDETEDELQYTDSVSEIH